MKKTLFNVCIFIFLNFAQINGQDKIGVSYGGKGILDRYMAALLTFQEISFMEISLTGQVEGKVLEISEIVCTEGESEEKIVCRIPGEDRVTLQFYGSTDKDGITKLMFFHNSPYHLNPKIHASPHFILMETFAVPLGILPDIEGITYPDPMVEYNYTETIPLVAYTSGIESEIEFKGNLATRYDYCLLRDKMEHPKDWFEKSRVANYVYYTIKITGKE